VFVLPVHDYATKLLEAGSEVRSLGRLPFLDVVSGEPAKVSCEHRLFYPARSQNAD
jgi:hypothetical protein